ncbi:hypothetical protein EAH88_11860 [Rhodanobacter glycinis]|uniref:Uncharacterized protein n=1 Tax=Rhodanobacter glycinis TaxID=582702 RepID=A0A502C8J2_9GAMM|nr:hypothetical protein [Rhodanobacter glycinis]TPG08319.1 hypothetical protein EAH88_11860 [Rhodanobacter glycinis]
MTDINLNALKAGINRLRTKGGADPSSLYDLVNGYVAIDGSMVSRGGTESDKILPSGTKGLCAFNGGMVVFSNVPTPITGTKYSCEVLVNPNDATQAIKEIHFAAPFMGFLYVVAEFDNGDVFHYWLQAGGTWVADTMYKVGDTVLPTVRNGFRYQTVLKSNPAAWAPNVPRSLGDVVQPTVYTGWKYTVVEVDGDNPTSAATEPVWPQSEGAQISEDVDSTPAPAPPPSTSGTPGSGRYGNSKLLGDV